MDEARAVVAELWVRPTENRFARVREWDLAAAMSAEAFHADGALSGSWPSPRPGSSSGVPGRDDPRPDRARLGPRHRDRVPGPLPADAMKAIYPLARAIVDRTPSGMFDAPVEVSTDAPVIDKLVALTGRHPSRR